ncbi:phosphopantetheine-binding protein [Kitasatospora sp. MAP5-34]|uniref:acyl carrier protein n=1 Tax=Kitasatospora sp. MAP5-34 TaxID=3035102 RepID=UPI002473AFE9|nr:phosphopantetheine-binding protein [Kitasatospora sp. MAP5-34]MDH6578185.1 methoxymalonate biosynthesis acyl carrier protein [Kitasatospora sp. MAP5-34]
MNHIHDEVRKFLIERGMPAEFADGDDLFAVGGLSSLMAMQIVTWVERHFDIPVRADDLRLTNFRSVESICAFIESRTSSLSVTTTGLR